MEEMADVCIAECEVSEDLEDLEDENVDVSLDVP